MATNKPAPKRSGGGAKLSRTETVTIRLDPKLRYLAELAARQQRRTVSSYIEWAIEESLRPMSSRDESGANIGQKAGDLWDVEEPDRFAKLAFWFPDLMTHEEQILWKLIRENGYLWRGRYAGPDNEWCWDVMPKYLVTEKLREYWDKFKLAARGEIDRSELPSWAKTKPKAVDFDEDIPF